MLCVKYIFFLAAVYRQYLLIVGETNLSDKAFLNAVYSGNVEVVHEQLRLGADPNTIFWIDGNQTEAYDDGFKITSYIPALHLAISRGGESGYHIATMLLDAGANPNLFTDTYPPAVVLTCGYIIPPSEDTAMMLLSLFSSDDHFSKFYVDQSLSLIHI